MSQTEPEGATATATAPPPPPPGTTTTTGYSGPTPPRPPRRGGVTVGIVLVLVGIVLLAAQLVPGLGLFSMWPLIIIVVGAVQAFTPDRDGYWSIERFFDGMVTVAFGLVFLAITTGYVGWGVWLAILSLWPVLLISAGLGIIGKATHQTWIKALGSIAVIVALGYAVATAYTGGTGLWMTTSTGGERFSQSEQTGSVEEGQVALQLGLADVTIDSGTDLVSAEGRSPFGTPRLDVSRSGSKAEVDFSLGDGNDNTVVWPGALGADANLRLSDQVVWDATIDAGATTLDADFSDIPLKRLELKPGVSTCTVRLGEVPRGVDEADAEIKAGVSAVNLLVPADAEVRIESDSGLVGYDIDSSFARANDGWETEGFSAAKDRGDAVWVVSVKSGLGTFSVNTY